MENNNFLKAYAWLEEHGISEQAINLVLSINGETIESLNDILFCEFGYREFDQLKDWTDYIDE